MDKTLHQSMLHAGLVDDGRPARAAKLDSLIPVHGLKRCISQSFEFVYPSAWLADVTIYRRRVESAELERGAPFQQVADAERVARRKGSSEPVVAFGPRGSSGAMP
jgi:hypothetical protein